MSFDPFGQHPESPPVPVVPGGASDGTPGGGLITPDVAAAMRRVQLPGIFLLLVGVLNLLVALFTTGLFIYLAVEPADKLYAMQIDQAEKAREQNPESKLFSDWEKELRKHTPEEFKSQAVSTYGGIAGVLLVTTLIVILGGVRMLQLRSYGFCILASLVAAAPFLSPSCCCGVGGVVGVWSIVVLLSPTVRMAFR